MKPPSSQSRAFWERPDMVGRFAARKPDHRLTRLIEDYPDPGAIKVLDLGCAGGRNAVLLAEHGFDFVAIDRSNAMIAETQRRLAEILGLAEAEGRARVGAMDHLDGVADGSIDLIVALGVYHAAESREEWDTALGESWRVLAPGGRVLVAVHTSEFSPDGQDPVPVRGKEHVYDGLSSGRSFLVSAKILDLEMANHGFSVLVPTETVRRDTEGGGRRVTANGLYQKP